MKEDLKQLGARIKETEEHLIAALVHKPKDSILDTVLSILTPTEHDKLEIVMPNHHELFQQVSEAIFEGEELPELPFDVQSSEDAEELARELIELTKTKQTVLALAQNMNLLLKGHVNVKNALDMLEENLFHIKHSWKEDDDSDDLIGIDEIYETLISDFARWHRMKREHETVGLPTKFQQLDKTLDGLQDGVHLLGAAPGEGKTTFMLQLARNVASTGYPVLFVSFEEPINKLWHKNIANAAGLYLREIFGGELDTIDDYKAEIDAVKKDLVRIYFLRGKSRTTVQQIKVKAKQLMQRFSKDRCLIIVDYLQYWANLKTTGKKSNNDFRFIVGDLASEIKASLADALQCPVLVISAQNRSGQGSNDLTSLRETGDLEYGADTVMFLTNPAKSKKKNGKKNQSNDDDAMNNVIVPQGAELRILHIEKNRFGETRDIKLAFYKSKGYFEELGEED